MSEKNVDNLIRNLSDGQRKEWKRCELKCPGRRAGWKISKTRNIPQNIGRNKEGKEFAQDMKINSWQNFVAKNEIYPALA